MTELFSFDRNYPAINVQTFNMIKAKAYNDFVHIRRVKAPGFQFLLPENVVHQSPTSLHMPVVENTNTAASPAYVVYFHILLSFSRPVYLKADDLQSSETSDSNLYLVKYCLQYGKWVVSSLLE